MPAQQSLTGLDNITGPLASIRFQSDEGFLIATLEDGTAIKGDMSSPKVGAVYSLEGKWTTDPKWGRQFRFDSYRADLPSAPGAIAQYLCANAKWIGPKVASDIVKAYGPDSLAVCKTDPERVTREVKGVTTKRAADIQRMLLDNEAAEQVELEVREILSKSQVSKGIINKVMAKWRAKAPAILRENPYRMITEIAGVGFHIADRVALATGITHDNPLRVKAGIIHTLREDGMRKGHTHMPEAKLCDCVARLLGVSGNLIVKLCGELHAAGVVVVEDGRVYLAGAHKAEVEIARKLRVLLAAKPKYRPAQTWDSVVGPLAGDQIDALGVSGTSNVCCITGAPGTGKTYTIKAILEAFRAKDITIKMAAPSGKAAKRMYEQTGKEATTIHRLLEAQFSAKGFGFAKNAGNPILADLIVIDETSMLDLSLCAKLLDAVTLGTRIIFIGDTHQLPSVGAGNVLRDLIDSGVIPCAELTTIKRQDAGLIIRNCHAIRAGENIKLDNGKGSDFFFLRESDPIKIQKTIVDLVIRRLPKKYGDASPDLKRGIQVLSPVREKTDLSCKALNAVLQPVLAGSPAIEGVKFRVGDKVINTKNDYTHGILNGDIGIVTAIDHAGTGRGGKTIAVTFDAPEREVELPLFDNSLDLAYAITVHKFQGSECDVVVIPIHRAFGPMIMQRNWLYTAISRAKRACILVGQLGEVAGIIKRVDQEGRHTWLGRRLVGGA